MKFSICLDAFFPQREKRDIYGAVERAAKLGAKTVEFWFWKEKDIELTRKALEDFGAELSGFCTSCFGLTDGRLHADFIRGLEETAPIAARLNCRRLITQAGKAVAGLSAKGHRDNILKGLKLAAPFLEAHGLTLLVEPLNTKYDHGDTYLWSSDETAGIIAEAGSPNVKMLFDIYHQQIMEGDVIRHIERNLPFIGHMHAAGVPGRHELNTGELDYANIFKAVDAMGYDGFMGLELFTDEPEKEIKRILNPLGGA